MRFAALTAILLLLLLGHGCGGADSNIIPDQRTAIIKYMESQKFDYITQGGVYKYIANIDREGRDKAKEAIAGDSLSFNFEAYTFTTAPGTIFYTNKKDVAARMTGLNTKYWSFEPVRVKVGRSEGIIKGLANALPYCREGDSVLIYITSDLAYGDKFVSLIEKNTALQYIVTIENIKK